MSAISFTTISSKEKVLMISEELFGELLDKKLEDVNKWYMQFIIL